MERLSLSPELTEIDDALRRFGRSAGDCVALIRSVVDHPSSALPVVDLKEAIAATGVNCDGDRFERVLLAHAIRESEPRIDQAPVHDSVKPLIRREFQRLLEGGGPSVAVGDDPFIAAAKMSTLRRFPSGPMDWVISGVPRSWFAKFRPRDYLSVTRFILSDFGGLRPAFFMHVAHPPRNRSLILRNEVRKSYYRMARSLELQPEIKGIMCASWLHDPEAMKDAPHLCWINEPYLEWGGRIVATLGPAPLESGFLNFSPERRKRFERGELNLSTTLAMWPRKAALAWAAEHPELADREQPRR